MTLCPQQKNPRLFHRGSPGKSSGMHRPLLITEDPTLLDHVLRITAASGLEVHVVSFPEGARAPWHTAPLVLVGADLAGAIAHLGLPRRSDVIVVAHVSDVGAKPSESLWPIALALGAEQVAALPEGERWLINRLRTVYDGPSRSGRILAVLGASGGAGASTLAAGLVRASVAAGRRALIIDADPHSAGIDLVLGAEGAAGVRWPDLANATGRISPQTLEHALPVVDGVVVVAPDPRTPTVIVPEVLEAVLDAGVRGFDDVIVDLSRRMDAIGDHVGQRAQRTLLVIPNRVLATITAGAIITDLSARVPHLVPVVRAHRQGIDPDRIAEAIGMPLFGTIPYRSHVAEAAECGDPPDTDEEFARACRELLNLDVISAAA